MLHLEITKGALVHNDYQNNLIDLFQVSYLVSYLMFLLIFFLFLRTFNSEFSYIEAWHTDQNSKPLEIEDKISITSTQ